MGSSELLIDIYGIYMNNGWQYGLEVKYVKSNAIAALEKKCLRKISIYETDYLK